MKHIYPEPSSNFSSFKMLCVAFIEKLKLCSSISQVCADDGCSHGPNILLPFINVVFIVPLCLLLTVPHIFLLISVFFFSSMNFFSSLEAACVHPTCFLNRGSCCLHCIPLCLRGIVIKKCSFIF